MNGLLIRQPHLNRILCGMAKYDRRQFRTQKRGRIALVDPDSDLVLGFADIVDVKPCTYRDFLDQYNEHGPTADQWAQHRNYFEIRFGNIERLQKPLNIARGDMDTVWVDIPDYLVGNRNQKSLLDF